MYMYVIMGWKAGLYKLELRCTELNLQSWRKAGVKVVQLNSSWL